MSKDSSNTNEANEIEPYDEFEDIRKHHDDWENIYG